MSPLSEINSPTTRSQADLPIAIIGGGLGGLALAVGLLKHGVKVHIYEAAQVFSEIGAGITFGANAARALGLIDEALLEGYKKHAAFNEDPGLDDTFYTIRCGVDERREGGRKAGDFLTDVKDKWNPEGAKSIGVRTRSCIHRARLLDVLVSLIPDGIASFGKVFKGVKEQADGTLELHFTDGTTALANAMVGCDGIKSKTREIICGPNVKASYASEFAYRGMVSKVEAEKALGVDFARNGHIYLGYGAYVFTYPIERGELVNIVAIVHDPGESWNSDDWTVPAVPGEEIPLHFKGFYPPILHLVEKHCQPFRWALFDLRHPAPYFGGRMCLLGDSAHATTPHLGAGAGMAMEDAYILSHLIAAAKGTGGIENAFRAYDAVRRPRTQKLVEYSRNASFADMFKMPGVGDNPDAIRKPFETWFKWLWHEDLEMQLEHAKSLL
jgi:salicylate hydroxylase